MATSRGIQGHQGMIQDGIQVTHTYTHTRTHAHTRTHSNTHSHTCGHTRTHTHTRAHTLTHAHTRTHAHTPKHTHPNTHTHTHTHTHTSKGMGDTDQGAGQRKSNGRIQGGKENRNESEGSRGRILQWVQGRYSKGSEGRSRDRFFMADSGVHLLLAPPPPADLCCSVSSSGNMFFLSHVSFVEVEKGSLQKDAPLNQSWSCLCIRKPRTRPS